MVKKWQKVKKVQALKAQVKKKIQEELPDAWETGTYKKVKGRAKESEAYKKTKKLKEDAAKKIDEKIKEEEQREKEKQEKTKATYAMTGGEAASSLGGESMLKGMVIIIVIVIMLIMLLSLF